MHVSVTPRFYATLLLFALAGAAGRAQNVVYAEDGANFSLVRAASGAAPLVEKNGKLVEASGRRIALKDVPEYAPYYVALRDFDVRTTFVDGGASEMNNTFELHANLVSPFALKNVFMVLDITTDRAGRNFFLWEVGNLTANQPKYVNLHIPLIGAIGEGRYFIHLFSDGREVFHSQMDMNGMEHALDMMVQRRIENVTNASPKPFVGPAPEYPSALRSKHLKGQAVVSFTISATGRVHDEAVKSASDPAFGEAALNAIRLWRFLPKVANGAPVTTHAELPFVFPPQ